MRLALAELALGLGPAEQALGLGCHIDMMMFTDWVSLTLNDSPWSSALPHVLCAGEEMWLFMKTGNR